MKSNRVRKIRWARTSLGLDHGGIRIHGTNRPLSIYLFGSHGCIRLSPDAAGKLFKMVSNSEAVEIIYQPVALAVLNDSRIFLESDADPYRMGIPHLEDVRTAARAAPESAARSVGPRASRVSHGRRSVARRIDRGGEPLSGSRFRSQSRTSGRCRYRMTLLTTVNLIRTSHIE